MTKRLKLCVDQLPLLISLIDIDTLVLMKKYIEGLPKYKDKKSSEIITAFFIEAAFNCIKKLLIFPFSVHLYN